MCESEDFESDVLQVFVVIVKLCTSSFEIPHRSVFFVRCPAASFKNTPLPEFRCFAPGRGKSLTRKKGKLIMQVAPQLWTLIHGIFRRRFNTGERK
jgi:hypothetical protein